MMKHLRVLVDRESQVKSSLVLSGSHRLIMRRLAIRLSLAEQRLLAAARQPPGIFEGPVEEGPNAREGSESRTSYSLPSGDCHSSPMWRTVLRTNRGLNPAPRERVRRWYYVRFAIKICRPCPRQRRRIRRTSEVSHMHLTLAILGNDPSIQNPILKTRNSRHRPPFWLFRRWKQRPSIWRVPLR